MLACCMSPTGNEDCRSTRPLFRRIGYLLRRINSILRNNKEVRIGATSGLWPVYNNSQSYTFYIPLRKMFSLYTRQSFMWPSRNFPISGKKKWNKRKYFKIFIIQRHGRLWRLLSEALKRPVKVRWLTIGAPWIKAFINTSGSDSFYLFIDNIESPLHCQSSYC